MSGDSRRAALSALASVAPLAGAVDSTVVRLVTQARSQGATWEDVGVVLGVTRQGAHARYAHLLAEPETEDVPTP